MMVIDPNTGLLLTCQPWEYAELCKSHGWIKNRYETNTTPIQKYDFTTSTVPNQVKEPKTSYTEKMILGEEEKAIAEKAAKLIARDYGETLKELEKDD